MAENTNYSTLIVKSLRDFQESFPEMTFGEIIYSFLKQSKLEGKTLTEIRELTDVELYNSIEEAIKYEQDEPLDEEQE